MLQKVKRLIYGIIEHKGCCGPVERSYSVFYNLDCKLQQLKDDEVAKEHFSAGSADGNTPRCALTKQAMPFSNIYSDCYYT